MRLLVGDERREPQSQSGRQDRGNGAEGAHLTEGQADHNSDHRDRRIDALFQTVRQYTGPRTRRQIRSSIVHRLMRLTCHGTQIARPCPAVAARTMCGNPATATSMHPAVARNRQPRARGQDGSGPRSSVAIPPSSRL
ncbi:hypothetical protein GCM10010244_85270 [Streptomyces coeruleorubidus]|nr:hypothetical protein GCM10010244_85270 [Streptomyces bellus]